MSERPAPPDVALAAPSIPPRVRATRTVALAALVALVVLGIAWESVVAPIGRGTLAFKVLPLALALPGLLRWRLYTCRWLSLLVWLYVAEGAMRLRDPLPHVGLCAALEITLALVLFTACALQVRWRLAAGRVGTPGRVTAESTRPDAA